MQRNYDITDYEENADPRKYDAGRRKHLKIQVNVRAQIGDEVTLIAGTHRTNTLSEGSRERVENIHGWSEPPGESLVALLIYFVGLPLKYGKDGVGRIATVYLSSQRMGSKVFAGLLFVLF